MGRGERSALPARPACANCRANCRAAPCAMPWLPQVGSMPEKLALPCPIPCSAAERVFPGVDSLGKRQ